MKKDLPKNSASSCGNCEKVHEILHVIIDDEATQDEENFFKDHVDDCSPCLEKYNIEKSLIDKIKSKLSHKCCPENIVKSIKENIKSLPSD